MLGINLAGGDFGKNKPGVYGKDYIYPPVSLIKEWAAAGAKAVRMPIEWSRIQPETYELLNEKDAALIKERVETITALGMICILDVHNYMRRRFEGSLVVGEMGMDALGDLWGRLAVLLEYNPLVWFNLMNEPHGVPQETIYQAQQLAIDAIRKTGSRNKILVSVGNWSAARSVGTEDNVETLKRYDDPCNNIAVDLHQYFNKNLDGTEGSIPKPDTALSLVASATPVLRSLGLQAVLGEFNAGDQTNLMDDARTLLKDIATHVNDNADVWLMICIWSGGPWWPKTYHYRETPDSERWKILKEILA